MGDGWTRRLSFNERADNYRLARPGYPPRLYDLLAEVCGLGAGSRVLEIGPGSGQATRELLARGAQVVAVEPGDELAAHLVADLGGPGLRVVRGDLETADLAETADPTRGLTGIADQAGGFDLAVAATSLHWVRLEVALPRLARALRPGGWLAVWWNVFGDPARVTDFRRALSDLYRHRLPHEHREPTSIPAPMGIESWSAELSADGLFEVRRVELIRWEHQLTAEGARRLFGSFPNINELPPTERESFLDAIVGLVEDFGGRVVDPYVTAVYLARAIVHKGQTP